MREGGEGGGSSNILIAGKRAEINQLITRCSIGRVS